ncbi:formyl-CoA transferase, partial [Streptomyces sp. NPDC002643]
KLSDSPTHITPSPLLGQHTHDILTNELGLEEEELRLLRSSGVI